MHINAADVDAALVIIGRYPDLQIGIADALLVVLAAQCRCRDLLSLDRRHFRIVMGPDDVPLRVLRLDDPSNDG